MIVISMSIRPGRILSKMMAWKLILTLAFMISSEFVSGESCYSCSGVANPSDCLNRTSCDADEVCFVSTDSVNLVLQYSYSCKSKSYCDYIMPKAFDDLEKCSKYDLSSPNTPIDIRLNCDMSSLIGKRQVDPNLVPMNVCSVCCGDSACNVGTCEQLKDQLYDLYKKGLWDLNTLKNVTTR